MKELEFKHTLKNEMSRNSPGAEFLGGGRALVYIVNKNGSSTTCNNQ